MIEFFDRPGEAVAPDLAAHWMRSNNPKEIIEGQSSIVGLETNTGVQLFTVDQVVLYGNEETMRRWKNTRGPEIAALDPGEVICYNFRGRVLTFVKTQGAENLMLASLRQTDRMGDPLTGKEAEVSASKIAQLAQLTDRATGRLSPFEFRGKRAFLLTVAGHTYSPEELQRLYEELLNPSEKQDS